MTMQNRILDTAEDIVRRRGYNGFSYSDIAKRTATTKAAIHHHFPKKADLGLVLIRRFMGSELSMMRAIEWDAKSCKDKLLAYFNLYDESLAEEKMCLCGIMAAEHETLPEPMQQALSEFFAGHTQWLTRLLQEGCVEGEFIVNGPAENHAQAILSAMQGALLIAKLNGDHAAIARAGRSILDQYLAREHQHE